MSVLITLSECGTSGFLKVLLFLKELMDIIFVLVPIGLIIIVSIDFAKTVIASDTESMRKVSNIAIKRMLYASIIFAIPWMISAFMTLLGDIGINSVSCLTSVDVDTIKVLEANEEIEREAKELARKEAIQENLSKNNLIYNRAEIAYNNANINGTKGEGCDGVIYYENGTYYKPTSALVPNNGVEETKGSGPEGYNKYFYADLQRFIEDAASEGFTIVAPETPEKGWRPYEYQCYYYCCYTSDFSDSNSYGFNVPYTNPLSGYTCTGAGTCNSGNTAARPGTSNHGWGIASDLEYDNYSAKEWAHAHAKDYNLNFSVCESFPNSCREPWHIEPLSIIYDDEKAKSCILDVEKVKSKSCT